MGGVVKLKWPVKNISQSENVENSIRLNGPTSEKEIFAKYVITCAGLHSDRIAKLTGGSTVPKIVPFRGEYLRLKKEKHHLVKQSNIYPVPDPRFPFLGVHFTPTIEGDVLLGPNAVLAYKREGYRKTDFSLTDLLDAITFPGFLRLMTKYWFYGIGEMYRSFRTSTQVKLLQQYIPELKPDDVEVGRAGVRAQALDMNGNLIEDFVFEKGTGPLSTKVLHVRNAPSPGATSSLAIAEMIVNKCAKEFGI